MSSADPPPRLDDLLLSESGGPAEEAPPSPQLARDSVLPSTDGLPSASASADLRLPKVLGGRYQITGTLGQGAFGSVLRAVDAETGREVALKIARDAAQPIHLERFRREGQITARFSHPGIVAIHDAGEHAGHPWIAYELIEGARTLEDVLSEGDLFERVERIRDTAEALGSAHAQGILHRDVKPANVLVDEDGRIRVADFGLALAGDLERLTRTGSYLGTPAYMAPEQLRGEADLGPQVDVWALGMMLYEALTGAYPFPVETLAQLVQAIASGAVEPPRAKNPDVSVALEEVCLRALAFDAAGRYPDASALAADLDHVLGGGIVLRSWTTALPIVAGLLAVVVPGVYLVVSRMERPTTPETNPTVATTTSAPTAGEAPTITLTSPRQHAASRKEQDWLRGRVEGRGRVEVRRGAQVLARVRAPGTFAVLVPLPHFGRVTLSVVAVDSGGRSSEPVSRTVWRLPAWFARLRGRARPPLPLPGALTLGETAGEYLNPIDGSRLVWVRKRKLGVRLGQVGDRADFFLGGSGLRPVGFRQGYFLGLHEVTWEQWNRFSRETGKPLRNPAYTVSNRHPVHGVSWYEAVAYCQWAKLRLPTDAEWLYAAVGAEFRKFPWGAEEDALHERANLAGKEDGFLKSAPVGSFPSGASACGALDMTGNLYEWVSNWDRGKSRLPPNSAVVLDPQGPASGTRKITRGGGYTTAQTKSRPNRRTAASPDNRASHRGFRTAIGY